MSIATKRVAALAVVVALGAAACSSAEDSAENDLQYAAFDVCTQFVKDRLRAPGTAEFPNQFEDDGEVTMTPRGGDEWRVVSHVDSENAFGGVVQSNFTCDVEHVGGDEWRLVNLDLVERR